jgi:hypothetical protein
MVNADNLAGAWRGITTRRAGRERGGDGFPPDLASIDEEQLSLMLHQGVTVVHRANECVVADYIQQAWRGERANSDVYPHDVASIPMHSRPRGAKKGGRHGCSEREGKGW